MVVGNEEGTGVDVDVGVCVYVVGVLAMSAGVGGGFEEVERVIRITSIIVGTSDRVFGLVRVVSVVAFGRVFGTLAGAVWRVRCSLFVRLSYLRCLLEEAEDCDDGDHANGEVQPECPAPSAPALASDGGAAGEHTPNKRAHYRPDAEAVEPVMLALPKLAKRGIKNIQ